MRLLNRLLKLFVYFLAVSFDLIRVQSPSSGDNLFDGVWMSWFVQRASSRASACLDQPDCYACCNLDRSPPNRE